MRGIPARKRNYPSPLNRRARLAIDSITPHRLPARDISETLFELVEPGVEETEGGFVGAEAGVVEEGDDAAEDGTRGGCAASPGEGVVDVDCVAVFSAGELLVRVDF